MSNKKQVSGDTKIPSQTLDQINSDILNCQFCNHTPHIGQLVVGEGPANAKIAIVGEAPGKQEAQTGLPFIGRSGKLLDHLINQNLTLLRSQIFITSVVKYLPPYITPKTPDIIHGRTHLFDQLNCIQPNLIILLGTTAVRAALEINDPITTLRGQTISHNNHNFYITLHPSAGLRSTKYLQLLQRDFESLKNISNL